MSHEKGGVAHGTLQKSTMQRALEHSAVGLLLLAGCTAGPDAEQPAQSGGTLRAALAGGSTETLNYLQGPTALDYVRARLVHAPLCELDPSSPDAADGSMVTCPPIAALPFGRPRSSASGAAGSCVYRGRA